MVIANIQQFVTSLEHVMGFFLVLLALILLWGITAAVGKLFKTRGAASARKEATAAAISAAEDELEEEEVAAIAATVAALIGPRSRVVSIRSSAKDWSREGRREHFASHKIR